MRKSPSSRASRRRPRSGWCAIGTLAALLASGSLWVGPWVEARAATFVGYEGGPNSAFLDSSASGLTSFTATIDGLTAEPLRASYEDGGEFFTEAFNVRIASSGASMQDLDLRWEGAAFTNFSRSPGAWLNDAVVTDRGSVRTAEELTGQDFYEVFLTFDTSAGAPQVALFDFQIYWFSPAGSPFDVVIRANAGGPDPLGVLATPLPGSVWLLASALFGLVILARARICTESSVIAG